jgi:hypothetical protein
VSRPKVTLTPGLAELVAARVVVPAVNRIGRAAADAAKQNAPGTKLWQTMEDSRVRPEHRRANQQEIPENLRFTVKSHPWDQKHRGLGEFTYMLAPRDESSRAVVNLINCRCWPVVNPDGIADLVTWEEAEAAGKRVRGTVVCEGNLVVQAEYGDVYPGGLVVDGTWFMHRAAVDVAARLRSGTLR